MVAWVWLKTRWCSVQIFNSIFQVPLVIQAVPHWFYRFFKIRSDYSFPYSTACDLASIRLSQYEVNTILSIGLILTLFRYSLEYKCKVKPWENEVLTVSVVGPSVGSIPQIWTQTTGNNLETFILQFRLVILSFCTDVCGWSSILQGSSLHVGRYLHTRYNSLKFSGWQSGRPPPIAREVAAVYALQAGYYLHSVYATLFMDLWRKVCPSLADSTESFRTRGWCSSIILLLLLCYC